MTIDDIYKMQEIDQTSETIGEWKRQLKVYADKFNVPDREIIALARSWRLPYMEAQQLFSKYL